MKMTYTLRDGLRHPHFSWPNSLVFLPGRVLPDSAHLIDDQGNEYAAQAFEQNGTTGAAVVTSLASGETKTFHHADGHAQRRLRVETVEDGWRISVSDFVVRLYRAGKRLFSLESAWFACAADASIMGISPELSRDIAFIQCGDVFADVRINVSLPDQSRYTLVLRIVEGLDYIGLSEDMTGFPADSSAELRLDWHGFEPIYRQNRYRKTEPIDAYLDTNGCIPIMVAPFDSWVSWRMDKSVSFMDEVAGCSAGLFVWRCELWDDHEYALWRSSDTLAVQFYDEDGRLSFRYPLRNGVRRTAVTIFSNALEAGKDFGASTDGLYGHSKNSPMETFYTERQWFWQEWISLDKVKDWTLRWPGVQDAFPRFFHPEAMTSEGMNLWYLGNCREPITPEQVERVVYELSNSLNQMIRTGPVSNREFYDWAIMYDQAIPAMTAGQFDDLKAAFAFCAYAFSDENYMPVRHMLAGHPNFLADARGVAAVAAALFPEHPDARHWKNGYELAMARNLKYHTRPDVKKWHCTGGRWTENLGTYVFAMLRPMCHASTLLCRTFGEAPVLYPNLPRLMEWLIGTVSAPVDGVRRILEAGAHSRGWLANQYEFTLWADMMARYAPMTAERLWYIGDVNGSSFEERIPGTSMYRHMAGKTYGDMSGTRPELKSAKYTGYGCVLRTHAHKPDEMCIQLIQIDEGPNYRWGRAGDGGCGCLYYYAAGKRYSWHREEDVGDWNKSAVQSCCNFGVLRDHEFHSVGRNELTEPLYDFGFAQYARVDACQKAVPFYRYRSVLMSGGDYIAVYDALGDKLMRGRFSWFNRVGEPFPSIVQVKPGASYVETDGGIPIDEPEAQPDDACRGRYYDGDGDFLTVVSHLPLNSDRGVYTTARPYGVQVDMQGRTDYVFDSASCIRFSENGMSFRGYVGIIRVYGKNRLEAALFDGDIIGAGGVTLTAKGKRFGACFSLTEGRLRGMIQAESPVQLELSCPDLMKEHVLALDGEIILFDRTENGVRFTAPEGKHSWEWTNKPVQPAVPQITRALSGANGVVLEWTTSASARAYLVELSMDCGKTWMPAVRTVLTSCEIPMKTHKAHVRVRGLNGETQGDPCWDYPVYRSEQPPLPPEGLKVWRDGHHSRVSWGSVQGASEYRLYRRTSEEAAFSCVYHGEAATFLDESVPSAEYAVSAIDLNGEGKWSLPRGTNEDGLEEWDPMPNEIFRRYVASHEYGYRGFDFFKSYDSGKSLAETAYPNA